MRSLNLDQLQSFIHVAETGSFSLAAKQLNLSQPAVSLQIRELEKRLGISLLDRIGKRAFATDAGRDLVRHAREIFAAGDDAASAMRRFREGWLGRVRIAAHEAICVYLLTPTLGQVRDITAGIEISVLIAATTEAIALVRSNEADFGIVIAPVEEPDLDVTPIYREPLVAVLPASRSLPAKITPEQMNEYPLIMDLGRGQIARLVRDWFSQVGLTPIARMEMNAHETIKSLVANGFGASIMPQVTLSANTEGVTFRPLDPPLWWQLCLIRRKDKPEDEAMRILRETIVRIGTAPARSRRARKAARRSPTSRN